MLLHVKFQFFFDIPDYDFNRSAIQNVDVLADERNHNTRHICVPMYGISEGTVDNAPQVIAKVDLKPSGRTDNMAILSLVVENHNSDIFFAHSVECILPSRYRHSKRAGKPPAP